MRGSLRGALGVQGKRGISVGCPEVQGKQEVSMGCPGGTGYAKGLCRVSWRYRISERSLWGVLGVQNKQGLCCF